MMSNKENNPAILTSDMASEICAAVNHALESSANLKPQLMAELKHELEEQIKNKINSILDQKLETIINHKLETTIKHQPEDMTTVMTELKSRTTKLEDDAEKQKQNAAVTFNHLCMVNGKTYRNFGIQKRTNKRLQRRIKALEALVQSPGYALQKRNGRKTEANEEEIDDVLSVMEGDDDDEEVNEEDDDMDEDEEGYDMDENEPPIEEKDDDVDDDYEDDGKEISAWEAAATEQSGNPEASPSLFVRKTRAGRFY